MIEELPAGLVPDLVMRGIRLILFGMVVYGVFRMMELASKRWFNSKRLHTLQTLVHSILRYLLYFIVVMTLLQEFGVNTSSILAGAGIFGLALGVGAQSLIRDTITGFFIILEDQYAVGDYVVIGDLAGTVEEIGFRVTKLRDTAGVIHAIPHGIITKVSNHSRGHSLAVVQFPARYRCDLNALWAKLDELCLEAETWPEVVERPKILGIVEFRETCQLVKIIAKTQTRRQAEVETKLRRKIADWLGQAGFLPDEEKRGESGGSL